MRWRAGSLQPNKRSAGLQAQPGSERRWKPTTYPSTSVGIIIARGGLIHPIESGVYEVNKADDQRSGRRSYGRSCQQPGWIDRSQTCFKHFHRAGAYIADPVVVDELQEVARISGHPRISANLHFPCPESKICGPNLCPFPGHGIRGSEPGGGPPGKRDLRGSSQKGRVIDVNNALDGEGPFGPERSGTLPAGALARYCLEKKLPWTELRKMLTGEGGLYAYLGHKRRPEGGKSRTGRRIPRPNSFRKPWLIR